MHTKFGLKIFKIGDHFLGDVDVGGRIILKQILEKMSVKVRTEIN